MVARLLVSATAIVHCPLQVEVPYEDKRFISITGVLAWPIFVLRGPTNSILYMLHQPNHRQQAGSPPRKLIPFADHLRLYRVSVARVCLSSALDATAISSCGSRRSPQRFFFSSLPYYESPPSFNAESESKLLNASPPPLPFPLPLPLPLPLRLHTMGEGLSELFEHPEFTRTDLAVDTSPEDLFSILETFEAAITKEVPLFDPFQGSNFSPRVGEQPNTGLVSQGWSAGPWEVDDALEEADQALKKRKLSVSPLSPTEAGIQDGQQKTSHIAVERNRRKQMNEHLSVLRTLMPCFYAKRVR
ncbi:hypothetical protein GW17_00028560 [Ensete ventricosum]|nr:hypothetical protein GW17_00028560 [Ensete ventricosum]RZS18114.1 hypothetical protein BHM03_00050339 [Ensete ventricosum]